MDDPIAIWGEEPKAELAVLTGQEQNATLLRLANRHAPHILLDNLEPFQPLVTGYSVIRQDGPSPSFERHIRLGLHGVAPNKSSNMPYGGIGT